MILLHFEAIWESTFISPMDLVGIRWQRGSMISSFKQTQNFSVIGLTHFSMITTYYVLKAGFKTPQKYPSKNPAKGVA